MTTLAAQKAGWFLDSEAPYSHTLPPPIKARLGHNGVESTVSEIVKVAAGPTWASVWVEHQGNVGYDSETPSTPYHNPWSEEMGIGDVEFCAAAATIIPHHHGVNWWPEAQFGVVGYAYCVDEETEIMTRHGWLREPDLLDGDEVMVFDPATSTTRWEPAVVRRFPAQRRRMLSLESRNHSSLTTEDHRWLVHVGRPGRWEWRTSAGGFQTDDRLPVRMVHADYPVEAKWSDAFVELVAWFWTEGHLQPGRGGKLNGGVMIAQSEAVNASHCARIRAALRAVFGEPVQTLVGSAEPGWREYRRDRGMANWYLNAKAGRTLLEAAPGRVPSYDFLLSLTHGQLLLFVATSLAADGVVEATGRRVLAQKSEAAADAFHFACVLLGEGASKHKAESDTVFKVRLSNRRQHTMLGSIEPRWVDHDGPVWCVTTPTGTWIARRHGRVFLTGNCPYLESGAKGHGVWQYDYASTGQPASLHPGDLVLYSWGNNGVADHVETVVNVYADGSFDCIGYDTGTPNGCHFPIRRDRTFLLGVVHMTDAFYSSNPPVPPTLPVMPMFNPPLRPTFCATQVPGGGVLEIGDDGSTMYLLVALRADQQHTGMNTPDKVKDWGKRIAASVRIGGCTYKVEGVLDTHPPAFDNMPFTIKDSAGEFYDIAYKTGQSPPRW